MAIPDEVAAEAEFQMNRLSQILQQIALSEIKSDKEQAAVRAKYAPNINLLTEERDQLYEKLTKLYREHEEEIIASGVKTLTLRSGKISSVDSESLVIDDPDAAMAYTRNHGMLRAVTKQPPRVFVAAQLEKYRDFVAKNPGMYFEEHVTVTVTPIKHPLEVQRKVTPHKTVFIREGTKS